MSIEEGEEVQAKGIRNIFNKIITEKFPNIEIVLSIQGTGNLQDTKQT
jgi:hypothetical protein